MGFLKLINGTLITPFRYIRGGTVVIRDGIIQGIHERDIAVPGATELDAKGQFVAPGFIDIHVHGGGGYDFMEVVCSKPASTFSTIKTLPFRAL